MMEKEHQYLVSTKWTGNEGKGTINYRGYNRSHTIQVDNKALIECSSDPAFNGDRTKHNPEELLVASLSSCHMLWYLHLCSEAGVVVTAYIDNAKGVMIETENGGGQFSEVILSPQVIVLEEAMILKAKSLHNRANKLCFIANSVTFPVTHKATITSSSI